MVVHIKYDFLALMDLSILFLDVDGSSDRVIERPGN